MTIGSFEERARGAADPDAKYPQPKQLKDHRGHIASVNSWREEAQARGRGFDREVYQVTEPAERSL